MIDISVVIPIYNAEKYLRNCLDSVVRQTIDRKEVICVDDRYAETKDSSVNIIKNYMQKYPWIKLYHQEYRGPSTARNLGIAKAQGRYIAFLDSDDWFLNEEALATLVRSADESKCKVCAGFRKVYTQKTGKYWINQMLRDQGVGIGECKKINFFSYQEDYHYHQYIYSRDMLVSNGISFPSDLRCYEDPCFQLKALLVAQEICLCGIEYYCYRSQDHMETMYSRWAEHIVEGIYRNMSLSYDNKLLVLQKKLVQRLNNDFYRVVGDAINHKIISKLIEIEKKLLIPEKIKILSELCPQYKIPVDYKPGEALLLNQYIWLLQKGTDFAKALHQNGLHRVAVYGLGNFSEMFYHAVKDSDIKLVAALDNSRKGEWHGLRISSPEATLPLCDGIIITPLIYPQIVESLGKLRKERLVAFPELIRNLHRESGKDTENVVAPVESTATNGSRTKRIINAIKVTIVVIGWKMPQGRRTLVSLRGQSLRQIEILVLSDTCERKELSYLERCVTVDSRVRVIDAYGMSPMEQYRLGIEQARGSYISFCRCIDYYEHDILNRFISIAEERDLPDAVKADYLRFMSIAGGEWSVFYGVLPRNKRELYGKCISSKQVPDLFWRDICIGNGIYKTSFLRKCVIKETSESISPERILLWQIHMEGDRLVYLEEPSYHQQMERNSYSSEIVNFSMNFFQQTLVNLQKKDTQKIEFQAVLLGQSVRQMAFWAGIGSLKGDMLLDNGLEKLQDHLRNILQTLSYTDREVLLEENYLALLAASPTEFLKRARNDAIEIIDKHRHFLQMVRHYPGVVIFGAGERGQSVIALLLRNGYQGKIAFCDNNKTLTGKEFQGIRVNLPEDATLHFWERLFVLPTPELEQSMKEQLLNLGIEEEHIVAAPEIWPYEMIQIDWSGFAKEV